MEFNRAKVESLVVALHGLETAQDALEFMSKILSGDQEPVAGHLLRAGVSDRSDALPDVKPQLAQFRDSFDAATARKTGSIEPKPGISEAFDTAQAAVRSAENSLEAALMDARRELKCSKVVFFTPKTGKDRYQLEVPESIDVPSSWTMVSKKKGVRRYHTAGVKQLVESYELAQARADTAAADVTREVFARFDASRALWARVARVVALVDSLVSLARVSCDGTEDQPMCRPRLVPATQGVRPHFAHYRGPASVCGRCSGGCWHG